MTNMRRSISLTQGSRIGNVTLYRLGTRTEIVLPEQYQCNADTRYQQKDNCGKIRLQITLPDQD